MHTSFSDDTTDTLAQRSAVANLTTYCEAVLSRDHLSPIDAMNLRYFVNEACAAFSMSPVQREEFERDMSVIKSAIGRVA